MPGAPARLGFLPFRVAPAEPIALAFIDPPDSVEVGWPYTYTVGVVNVFGNRVPGIGTVRVKVTSYAHYNLIRDTVVVLEDGKASFEPNVVAEWRWVVSGPDRTCGPLQQQRLYCWGNSADGLLATDWGPRYLPNPVVETWRWRAVEIGRDHTCATDISWVVYCWGSNEFGQLGINDPSVECVNKPTPVDTDQKFAVIAAGRYHTCGITNDTHRVLCWGRNDHGQLGLGLGGDMVICLPRRVGPGG